MPRRAGGLDVLAVGSVGTLADATSTVLSRCRGGAQRQRSSRDATAPGPDSSRRGRCAGGAGVGAAWRRPVDGGGVFHGEQQDGEVELRITEWTRTLLRDGCARVDGAHDVAAALMQRCGAVRRRGRRRGAGSTVWPCWPPARNTARRQARRRSSPAEGEQEARKGKEAAA